MFPQIKYPGFPMNRFLPANLNPIARSDPISIEHGMRFPALPVTHVDVALETAQFGNRFLGDQKSLGGAVGRLGEGRRRLERVFGLGLPGWALREEGDKGDIRGK